MATALTLLMALIVWIEYVVEWTLERFNIQRWNLPIPKEIAHLYTEEAYNKAKAYNYDKQMVSRVSTFLSTAILIAILFYGGFGKLHDFIATYTQQPLLQTLAFFGVIGFGSGILGLPFSIYNTFVIEEKYGFNKTTPALFVADLFKGMLLGTILGGLILSAIVWFYQWQPVNFWLYAWIMLSAISIFMSMFYTSIIVPLFNKLTPLEDGELKTKIEALSLKTGYPLKHVYVLDASKRSTKANAYFSGFGPKKTIVLFDTLLQQMTDDEVVAVLAHEIGHYKKKHVLQSIFISVATSGIMLYLLSLCVGLPAFHEALGSKQAAFHLGLIAFSVLYTPISTFIGIAMNYLSRKNEFEADAFAKTYSDAKSLVSGLEKLHTEQLGNINPHPAYVFVHYSHPPLLQRVRALLS